MTFVKLSVSCFRHVKFGELASLFQRSVFGLVDRLGLGGYGTMKKYLKRLRAVSRTSNRKHRRARDIMRQ